MDLKTFRGLKNLPDYFTDPTQLDKLPVYKTREDYDKTRPTSYLPYYSGGIYSFALWDYLGVSSWSELRDCLSTLGCCPGILGNSPLRFSGSSWAYETWDIKKTNLLLESNFYCFVENTSVLFNNVAGSEKYYDFEYGSVPTVTLDSAKISCPAYMSKKLEYNDKPKLEFRKSKQEKHNTYLGVEIEVSSNIPLQDLQYLVCDVEPKQDPFFFFKHDGSIEGSLQYKYEIVTFPCTPKYLREQFRTLFKKLEGFPEAKFQCNESTGVHIHINGESFDNNEYRTRGYSLNHRKFTTFWNGYDRETTSLVKTLGGRNFTHYCKPALNHDGRTLARRLKEANHSSDDYDNKYSACRTTENTVEVRVFKGGFELDHLLYCIETVLAVREFTVNMPLTKVTGSGVSRNFKLWLEKRKRTYPKLAEELRKCA